MSPDTGVEGVLSALARFQCGDNVSDIIHTCGQFEAMTAASIKRAQDIGAFEDGASEPEIVSALISYQGHPGRRRILSHLRKEKVIQRDVSFYKVMHPGSAPTLKTILKHAADRNGRKLDEVLSESRRSESVMARFEAGWTAVRIFGFPIMSISDVLRKNHATVLSGINKIDILIQRSPVRLDGLLDMADSLDMEAIHRFCALLPKDGRGPLGPAVHISSSDP